MYNPILFLRISSREFVSNRFKRRTLSHFLLQVSLRRSRAAFWRDSFHSNLYPNNIIEYSSLKMWQDFFPFLSSPDRVPRANTLFRTNSLESISIFSVLRQNNRCEINQTPPPTQSCRTSLPIFSSSSHDLTSEKRPIHYRRPSYRLEWKIGEGGGSVRKIEELSSKDERSPVNISPWK